MKRFLYVMQLMVLGLATPAWALSNTSSCEAQAQSLQGTAHDKFLVDCLARESSPEHVRALAEQRKRGMCEQNAQNMKLEGGKKSGYINDCMTKNTAASVATKYNVGSVAKTKPEHPVHHKAVANAAPKKPIPHKPRAKQAAKKTAPKTPKPVTCSQQADQQKLSGDTRNKFLSDCRKG